MPEVWGGLPKAQNDNELIEEAIARRIAEHNADETSHLAPGQSLQSHKASAIIDHLALSIVSDKIADQAVTTPKLSHTRFYVRSSFESLDGWEQFRTGNRGSIVLASIATVLFNLGGTANDYAALYFWNQSMGSNMTPHKPLLEVIFSLNSPADHNFIIFVGNDWVRQWDGGFGFIWKASAQRFFAWWKREATLHEFILPVVNPDVPHRLRCESFGDRIKFSIDGQVVYTATANLPTYNDEGMIGVAFQTIGTRHPQGVVSSLYYVQDYPF